MAAAAVVAAVLDDGCALLAGCYHNYCLASCWVLLVSQTAHVDSISGHVTSRALLLASSSILGSHHELKHKRQPACGLVIQHLQQLDDVGVRRQAAQRLDLTQVVDLQGGMKRNTGQPEGLYVCWAGCACARSWIRALQAACHWLLQLLVTCRV